MINGPVFETFLVIYIIFAFLCIHFHHRFIMVAVIREYFMTFSRSLLGLISGGYVITVLGCVAMVVMRMLEFDDAHDIFEITNIQVEIMMNFLKFFYFADVYIGNYRGIFRKCSILGFLVVFFSILCAYVSFLIPEFLYRGHRPVYPSSWVSLGITSVNILLNFFIWYSKHVDINNKRTDVSFENRFLMFEAKETAATMLLVTAFRCTISAAWVLFNIFPVQHANESNTLGHLLFGFFRCLEAIIFPIAFLYYHERIQRHHQRQRADRNPARPMEQRRTDGGLLPDSWEGNQANECLERVWRADFTKSPQYKEKKQKEKKEKGRKKQDAVTESEEHLLAYSHGTFI